MDTLPGNSQVRGLVALEVRGVGSRFETSGPTQTTTEGPFDHNVETEYTDVKVRWKGPAGEGGHSIRQKRGCQLARATRAIAAQHPIECDDA